MLLLSEPTKNSDADFCLVLRWHYTSPLRVVQKKKKKEYDQAYSICINANYLTNKADKCSPHLNNNLRARNSTRGAPVTPLWL